MNKNKFISLEGIDDEYDNSKNKDKKKIINSTAATLVKLIFFLFALFMMIVSDTGIRLLTKIDGATLDGSPTLYGHGIQGAVLSILFVIIYALVANEVV